MMPHTSQRLRAIRAADLRRAACWSKRRPWTMRNASSPRSRASAAIEPPARRLFPTPLGLSLPLGAISEHGPDGRVVAGVVPATNVAVDAGTPDAACDVRAEQNVIEAQAGIARPASAFVVPVG